MSSKAVESIEAAIEDTKEFLMPFKLGKWLKLGLITLLTGGGINFPSIPQSGYEPASSEAANQATGAFFTSLNADFRLIGAAIALIGLVAVFFYINSVFTFILYQSLRKRSVLIRKYFKNNTGRGIHYLGFKVAFLLSILLVIVVAAAAVIAQPLLIIPLILLGLPLIIAIPFFSTIVHDIVLLEMLEKDVGIWKGIKDILSEVKSDPSEVIIYLVLKIGLGILITMITLFGGLILLLVLLIPFGLAAAIAAMFNKALLALIALLGILTFLVLLFFGIMVPIRVFMTYYAIEFYSRFRD